MSPAGRTLRFAQSGAGGIESSGFSTGAVVQHQPKGIDQYHGVIALRRFIGCNCLRRISVRRSRKIAVKSSLLSAVLVLVLSLSATAEVSDMTQPVSYHTIQVDGVSIFYREAGPANAPVILLLHGFPSSSRMFEPLLERLSGSFHLIAPDYPGFGHSDWPNPKDFPYTFDRIATVMQHFTEALHLQEYTVYMQDYGGPVGFRLVLAHPERVRSLIVQIAVSHIEGLGEPWMVRRGLWAVGATQECEVRSNVLSLGSSGSRLLGCVPHSDG
jgi:hypothetical protein